MTTPSNAQRSILMQLLRDDHPQPWTRAEIQTALDDLPAQAISDALARLEAEAVVVLDGEQVQASRAARYIDALGLICV
jgi:hypothetical protein